MEERASRSLIVLWAVVLLAVPTFSTNTFLAISQYFANQTYSWRQYACTEDERACFQRQQLLHEADGQCYSAGGRGPCAVGAVFHADKREALRKGGHLRGSCANACAEAHKRPVAATGECLSKAEVQAKICREDWYLRPAMDVFGEWVCEWTQLLCSPKESLSFLGSFDSPFDGICSAPNIFNVISDGPNATVPTERPADHPMLQYFTNKTYLEREFPCSEAEKECLQYGRLLQSDGKCYAPGQWSSHCEPGQVFHIDWDELVTNGRLHGTCRSTCGSFKYPQIVSGQCEDFGSISNICRWEWGLQSEQNVFAQMACTCSWSPSGPRPAPPSLPPPASTPGYCRAPDFSNPVRSPSYDQTLTVGFSVPCSAEEHACLREGRVLAHGACHALRTQGPCTEGEELVLDKVALAHASLQAVCKTRPCPDGSVRLPIDGRCLTHQQVVSIMCAGQQVALDEFGGWQCHYDAEFPANLTRTVRDAATGECVLPERYPALPIAAAGGAFSGPGAPGAPGAPGQPGRPGQPGQPGFASNFAAPARVAR